MRKLFASAFSALALVAFLLTLAGLIRSDQWWLQVLDFPRLLFLLAIVVIAVGVLITVRTWRAVLLGALAVAAAIQLWRIASYLPFPPVEVTETRTLGAVPPSSCFTVLGLNVLQSNRDYPATLRLIERERPDLLLLMETDGRWVDALAPVLARYPHRLLRPIDNTYGLVFASKLPVVSARTENITDHDTPTVYARLTARNGQPFDYVGLHPRPPAPGQDTDARDRKIARAALRIAGNRLPALAMGDFNDVAWSPTTRLFKQVGGYLDPRIGRGTYPSFPSRFVAAGWPLDHLFVTPAFTLRSLRIGDDVGSDHRPLLAELCLTPKQAARVNASPDPLGPAARKAARLASDTGEAR